MRVPANIAAVVFAPAVLILLLQITDHIHGQLLRVVVTGLYFGWAIVIAVFYGRDLYLYLRGVMRNRRGNSSVERA